MSSSISILFWGLSGVFFLHSAAVVMSWLLKRKLFRAWQQDIQWPRWEKIWIAIYVASVAFGLAFIVLSHQNVLASLHQLAFLYLVDIVLATLRICFDSTYSGVHKRPK